MSWLDDPIQGVDARPNSAPSINAGNALISSTLGFVNPLGIEDDNTYYPFNLTNVGSVVDLIGYSSIGMAVAFDPSAANSVRLAQAGDTVIGQLKTVENRTTFGQLVCTVSMSGAFSFPIDTTNGATLPTLGSRIKGGTIPGTVVLLAAAAGSIGGTVIFVDGTNMVCTVIL